MALFTVTNLNDSGADSLRQAVLDANASPGADEIEFGSLSGILSLTSGELEITDSLSITGPGANLLSLSGNNLSRIFFLNRAETVSIEGLTLTGGNTIDEGGAIFNLFGDLTLSETVISGNTAGDDGGALHNAYGYVTIIDSTISGNTAGDDGGAISNNASRYDGFVSIIDSMISGNTAGDDGGAISNDDGIIEILGSVLSDNEAIDDDGGAINNDGGSVSIQESTLSGNIAGDDGGVIENTGVLYIFDSTLSENTAGGVGGAIDNDNGFLFLINSTISGNSAALEGGGIYNYNYSRADLFNGTISDNSAASGGGIFNSYNSFDPSNSGEFNITNTIIANSTGGDCVNNGTISGNANNLIEDGSCNPFLSGDPNLGPLQDNGGPTFTHALLPGSIAIDAGDNNFIPFTTDQRGVGFDRIVNGTVDIGAFEAVPEPSALFGILTLGIVAIAARWRRR
jgi:PEP-CTERM motif